MAYGGGMGYHLHMPSYFWRTFTEYPSNNKQKKASRKNVMPRNSISYNIFSISLSPTALILFPKEFPK